MNNFDILNRYFDIASSGARREGKTWQERLLISAIAISTAPRRISKANNDDETWAAFETLLQEAGFSAMLLSMSQEEVMNFLEKG